MLSTNVGDFRFSRGSWRRIVDVFLRERTAATVQREARCSFVTSIRAVERMRRLMTDDAPAVLSGICEADETYFGGLWRNLHNDERFARKGTKGRKTKKTGFLGIVSRTEGKAIVVPIPNAQRRTLLPKIRARVQVGSTIYTDGLWAYRHLPSLGYRHDFVEHDKNEYVRGEVYTQTIEGLWGTMKARLKTVGGIRKGRLSIFVGEQLWRYNFRHLSHEERIQRLLDLLTRIGGRS
jgi:transposase-like protein